MLVKSNKSLCMQKLLSIPVVALVLLTACQKTNVYSPDNFDVTVDNSIVNVNDTITFNLSGSPDFITFYSGEPGRSYELSKVTKMESDSTLLNFSTSTTAPGTTTQPLSVNNVSILVSTNFNGKMDSASIASAAWTDISNRFTFATTTSTVQSKVARVDDLKVPGAPFYVAFKYVSDSAKATSLPRRWTIASFGLRNHFNTKIASLAGGASGTTLPFTTGGFVPVSLSNSGNHWNFSSGSLVMNAASLDSPPDVDWAISRPFDLSLYPSDIGEGIKNNNMSAISTFTYQFSKPGTYQVAFVAKNSDKNTIKETVRQLSITVK